MSDSNPKPSRRPTPKRDLVTIANLADELGVSQKTIRRRIADGTLVAYRLGGRIIRVDRGEAIQKLLRPIGGAA